jgi:hypothetical protein
MTCSNPPKFLCATRAPDGMPQFKSALQERDTRQTVSITTNRLVTAESLKKSECSANPTRLIALHGVPTRQTSFDNFAGLCAIRPKDLFYD